MNKQEDFYDILRSKMTERDITAPEEDWREMRNMIDDSRKRKKRITWATLSVAILLLGIGTYFILNTYNHRDSTAIAASVTKENVKENTETDVVRTNTESQHNSAVSSNNKVQPGEQTSIVNNTSSGGVISKSVHERTLVAANSKVSKPLTVTSGKPGENYNKPDAFASRADESLNTTVPKKQFTSGSSEETVTYTSKNKPAVRDMVASNNVEKNQSVNSANNEPQVPAAQVTIVENKTALTTNNVQNQEQPVQANKNADTAHNSQLPSANNAPISFNNYVSTTKHDSATPKPAEQQAPLPPLNPKSTGEEGLYIDGGAGYSLGWKYGDTAQGRSINPYLGIGYKKSFNDKWSVKFGLGINALGNMGSTVYTIKHETYDFQYKAQDTTVTTKWLIYLTLPVQVELNVGTKNAIGMGGSISYLVNGWGQVDAYTIAGNTIASDKKYTQYMYVAGYNRWNASIFMLYRRSITNKLSIYLKPYFGLMDIKNNTFFGRNTFERDLGFKIQLSYRIF